MKTSSILASLLFLPLLSFGTEAQSVHLRGKVENGEGACYYCPGFDFVIDKANFPITSSVYDLTAFIGLQIDANGVWDGSLTEPVVDITSLITVNESFSIGGGGKVGESSDFTASGVTGDLAVVAGAFGAGFIPAFSTNELFLLDPSTTVVLGAGILDSNGELKVPTGVIGSDLLGVSLFGQAWIKPAAGGPAYLSNLERKTIK